MSSETTNLRSRLVCPHCWHPFSMEETLSVSACRELIGDFRLGPNVQKRFLPDHFDVNGVPLDERGYKCQYRACPNCHLIVPDSVFYGKNYFISIAGAQAAGKTYYLTSMTYTLRRLLPNYFGLSFTDADPTMNASLIDYENRQFENNAADEFTLLEKTAPEGDNYNIVQFDHQIRFLKPYLFSLRYTVGHPRFVDNSKNVSVSSLCLYDNAGESYDPGQDNEDTPFTRHLKYCHAIMFILDPLQNIGFRQACSKVSSDPQIDIRNQRQTQGMARVPLRQEIIFDEMIRRFRFLRQLKDKDKTNVPLLVVVTKFDAWAPLIGLENLSKLPSSWLSSPSLPVAGVNSAIIDFISEKVREVLAQYMPSFCSMAENFSQQVKYIPVSATGCAPTQTTQGLLAFRPRDLAPVWCETPSLYFLNKCGLTMRIRKNNTQKQ